MCNSLRKCIALSAMKVVNLRNRLSRRHVFFFSNPFFIIRTPLALRKGEKEIIRYWKAEYEL